MNKILMVEEEVDTVRKVHEHLSRSGFEFLSAYDGLHGFEIAKTKNPDLIIIDAIIPRMNSIDFCKAIRQNEITKSIPIIVLTEKKRMEESFIFLGIRDFLNKPICLDELECLVRNKLNIAHALLEKKTKILISGRPEILSCCQELLKNNVLWSGYFSADKDSFLKDAIKYSPDVIFMDLLMPGMFSDEIILKLKLIPELTNTVILTYYSSTSLNRDPFAIKAEMIEVQYLKILTADAGANEYLGPFNPATFLKLIDIYRIEI